MPRFTSGNDNTSDNVSLYSGFLLRRPVIIFHAYGSTFLMGGGSFDLIIIPKSVLF
jgi:hypothetical protein